MFRQIGLTMQISETSGLSIVMVPCLHQSNIYIKRNLYGCRVQKYNFWGRVKSVRTCTKLQITHIHASPYRAYNPNFRNFGASYCHGTVFVRKQYLYQKEALGIQSPKINYLAWCKKCTNIYEASNYPHSCVAL